MKEEYIAKKFRWVIMMIFVSAFQIISSAPVIFASGKMNLLSAGIFYGFIALEWLYLIGASLFFGQNNFELEVIGFLLSGIGLTVSASANSDFTLKQSVSVLLGVFVYIFLLVVLRRTDIVMKLRLPVAALALMILAINLVFAKVKNGALNWITVGGVSIQPSEIVKLAFVFVGAASLDKLQTTRSITKYIVFAVVCVGSLFMMKDFGTALIFFFTFIIIAFMRSGDFRTIALICVAAALGAVMIIFFKPYVATRFQNYRHVWESVNGNGMQQTRVMIYSASGGLFGLGIGNGKLKNVFAATTDLVFGIVCEEWGLIIGILILSCFAFLVLHAIKISRNCRSTLYAIAACAAAGMLLFQTALNVFGVNDILPLTGVTLPFISRGGSSMICSWGLLAFIKAADIRTYPKLSKTILPDHPLYPPDVFFNKRTRLTAQQRYAPGADVPISRGRKYSGRPSDNSGRNYSAGEQNNNDISSYNESPNDFYIGKGGRRG